MSFFDRSATLFALGTVTLVACGGATSPTTGEEASQGSEIKDGAGGNASGSTSGGGAADRSPIACDANPPPNARCASACPYGYQGAAGTFTCQCCPAPPPPSGEICGGPPPNARCMACPGGPNSYKQVDGKPTCECCASGSSDPKGEPAEICGGPPPNARCMACPGGYKQIDGQPSCVCCSE